MSKSIDYSHPLGPFHLLLSSIREATLSLPDILAAFISLQKASKWLRDLRHPSATFWHALVGVRRFARRSCCFVTQGSDHFKQIISVKRLAGVPPELLFTKSVLVRVARVMGSTLRVSPALGIRVACSVAIFTLVGLFRSWSPLPDFVIEAAAFVGKVAGASARCLWRIIWSTGVSALMVSLGTFRRVGIPAAIVVVAWNCLLRVT